MWIVGWPETLSIDRPFSIKFSLEKLQTDFHDKCIWGYRVWSSFTLFISVFCLATSYKAILLYASVIIIAREYYPACRANLLIRLAGNTLNTLALRFRADEKTSIRPRPSSGAFASAFSEVAHNSL